MSERDRIFRLVQAQAWDEMRALLPSWVGDDHDLARVFLAGQTKRDGRYDLAVPPLLQILEQSTHVEVRSIASNFLGECFEATGNLARAEENYFQGYEANSDPHFRANALNCLAGFSFRSCLHDRARGLYRDAIDLAPNGGEAFTLIFSWIGYARTSILRGESGTTALSEAEQLIDRYEDSAHHQRPYFLTAKSEQALLDGDWNRAEEGARQAIETFKTVKVAALSYTANELLVSCAVASGQLSVGRALDEWTPIDFRAEGRKILAAARASAWGGIPWGQLVDLPQLLSIQNPGVRLAALKIALGIPEIPAARVSQIREAIGSNTDGLTREMFMELAFD